MYADNLRDLLRSEVLPTVKFREFCNPSDWDVGHRDSAAFTWWGDRRGGVPTSAREHVLRSARQIGKTEMVQAEFEEMLRKHVQDSRDHLMDSVIYGSLAAAPQVIVNPRSQHRIGGAIDVVVNRFVPEGEAWVMDPSQGVFKGIGKVPKV